MFGENLIRLFLQTWDDYMEMEVEEKVKNAALEEALVDGVGSMLG